MVVGNGEDPGQGMWLVLVREDETPVGLRSYYFKRPTPIRFLTVNCSQVQPVLWPTLPELEGIRREPVAAVCVRADHIAVSDAGLDLRFSRY